MIGQTTYTCGIRAYALLIVVSAFLAVGETARAAPNHESRRVPEDAGRRLSTGVLSFASDRIITNDNRCCVESSIGLFDHGGAPIAAIQFQVVNTVGKLRFRGAGLGASIENHADWHLSWHIRRGPLQPDLGSTDTLSVVILGLNGAGLGPGDYTDLARLEFDVVNISGNADSTELALHDVLGSDEHGSDARLLAGPAQSVIVINTVSKGDLDGNDEVDINDLLAYISVILGKSSLSGRAAHRADIAPWPTGDEAVNVRDLALTQRVILNGSYPDGTPLKAAPDDGKRFAAKTRSAAPDVKLTVYVYAGGIAVHMTNLVRVKGIQLELNNVTGIPDTMRLRTIFDPGPTWSVTAAKVLVLLMYNDAALPVEPGSGFVTFLPFTISNPVQINLKKLIVADENNMRITNLEASIVYAGPPSAAGDPGSPFSIYLEQNYPNPFSSKAVIRFATDKTGHVSLNIYSVTGSLVREMKSGVLHAGAHLAEWDGRNDLGAPMPSGVYTCILAAGSVRLSRQMLLMR